MQWTFLAFVLIGAGLALLPGSTPESAGRVVSRELMVLAFFAAFPVALAAHEAGHALAGRALGLRVESVRVGCGRAVLRRRLGSVAVDLRLVPAVGLTRFRPAPRRAYRLRMLIAVAAGPAASAVVLLVGLRFLSSGAFGHGLMVGGAFGMFNLVPLRRVGGLPLPSDGMQLIRLLTARRQQLDDLVAGQGPLRDVAALYREGRYDEAEHLADRHLRDLPDSLALATFRACAIGERRPVDGHALFREMLSRRPLTRPGVWRAAALNGLAWNGLIIGDADLLAEADAATEEAMRLAPTTTGMLDTRGFALIETGRADEGLALAQRYLDQATDPRARAGAACILALGHTRLGDSTEAEAHLLEGVATLGPDHPLVQRVETEVRGLNVPA